MTARALIAGRGHRDLSLYRNFILNDDRWSSNTSKSAQNKSERSQHPKFLDLIPPSCPRNAPAFRELAYRYPTEKPAAHLAQHPAFRRQMATSMLSIDKRPSWLQDLLVSSYQRKFSCSALSKIKKRAAPIHRTRMVTATTRIRRSS